MIRIKEWKKIFKITVIIVVASSFIYILALVFAKALLVNKVKSLSNKKVKIDSLMLMPPFTLEVRGLSIEGVGKVERLSVTPSVLYLLIGRLAFNKIELVRPEATYERLAVHATGTGPDTKVVTGQDGVSQQIPGRFIPLAFKRVIVRGGKLHFVDHIAEPREIRVTIKDIDLNLSNFYTYPSRAVMRFSLEGSIPWQPGNPDGKVSLKGWIDLYKKNMQADLSVENIDGIALYPYYATWVDLEKARIEKAKLNFKSNIKGVNNDVDAVCRLELTDIVRKPRPPEEPQEKAERITDAVLDMFKSMNQGKVLLDFTLHTKMDRPEFGFANIRSAFEGKLRDARKVGSFKLENALALPGKAIEGGVKGGLNLSRAVFDGVFAVGNEIKNILEGAFRKEAPAEADK